MSETTAKTLVLVSYAGMLALIGLNTSGKYSKTGTKFTAAWAASVFGLLLSFLADVAPQIAGPLAILALIAVSAKNPAEIGPLLKVRATSTSSGSTNSPAGGAVTT